MPYLGKSPSQAVRRRYQYVVSANATSVSGSDANGNTLLFSDGEYVDVYLNGVKLKADTDYNTSTANTIASLSALAASDEITVVVYDTFGVFSGTFSNDVTIGGNLKLGTGSSVSDIKDEDNMVSNSATALSTQQSIKAYVDATVAATNEVVEDTSPQLGGNLDVNGNDITSASSLTLDIAGNLNIDVDGTTITLADDGVNFGQFYNNSSGTFNIVSPTQDKDIVFRGNDGGSGIVALTLDMSDGGTAIFNSKIGIGTTTPNSIFEIRDDASPTIRVTDGDANNIAFMQADAGNGGYFGTLTSHDVRLAPNNSTKMIVKVDGKVGIGVTSPAVTLELAGNGGAIRLPTGGELQFGNANNFVLGNSGSNYLAFTTNSSERLRIDSSGKVGIGTSSPSQLLDIVTSANAPLMEIRSTVTPDGSKFGGGIVLGLSQANDSGSGQPDTQAGDTLGRIIFEGQGTDFTYNGAEISTVVTVGDGNDGRVNQATALVFKTIAVGGDSSAETVRFSASENVFNEGSADIDFRVESNGVDKMLFVNGGTNSVSIGGEATPLGRLHVITADSGSSAHANADEFVIEGSAYSGMTIASGNSSHGTIAFADSGDELAGRIIYNHSTNALSFGAAGVGTQWSINSDGNLLPGNSTGQGIHLGVTSAAASNLLDDYEEGTWTPSGPSLGVATVHKAVYTKIGNVVTVYCDVTYNSSPSDTAQATSMSGLPFSASDDYYQQNTRVAGRNQNISAQVGGATVSFRDVADGVIMTRSEFAGNRAQHTFIYTTA